MSHGPPPVPFRDCTGALVAGGRASRLAGVAKGLLLSEGESILSRSMRLFGALFRETLLVVNDAAPYGALQARIVADVFPGKGAPGGLHAALAASRTDWVFTAACDMPFLAAGPITWLAARRQGAPAVAVRWQGKVETLHAFWSRGCLPAVEELLRGEEPSLWAIATAVGARIVDEEEWRLVDPQGRSFANANTPDDAARLGLTVPPSGAP